MSQTAFNPPVRMPTAPDLVFRPAVTRPRMKGLLCGFYAAALASCYVPFSLKTPIGFLSLVDIIIMLWFPFAFIGALVDNVKIGRGGAILVLCWIAFGAVLAAQSGADGANGISPVIKFAIFLVVAPLSVQFSNFGSEVLDGRYRPSRIIAISGALLALTVLFKVVTHQAGGSGDVYYVVIFGGQIQKNWLGMLLTTSIIAAMFEWSNAQTKIYLWMTFLQLLAILTIGARAATIGSTISACLIYLYLNPLRSKGIYKRLGLLIIAAGLASLLVVTLFSGQLHRLQELQQTDTRQVNASNARLVLWAFAAIKILQKPWLGWGHGTFHYVGIGWLDGMYEPHNAILQITYANGVIGLSIFILLIIVSLRKNHGIASSFIRTAACFYLAEAMVDIIWTRGDGHIFWILLFTNAFSVRNVAHEEDLGTGASPPTQNLAANPV